jgi:hypothetical protein
VQRVAPKLPLLLSNAFELMCLFCAPGTHDQKCTAVPFISTCYFAKVVANTLCDVGFASRGLRFRVTRILEMGVPMTRDSVESWIKSHILSLPSMRPRLYGSCLRRLRLGIRGNSILLGSISWGLLRIGPPPEEQGFDTMVL